MTVTVAWRSGWSCLLTCFVFGFCQILIVKTITLEDVAFRQRCWMSGSSNRKKIPECLLCVYVCVCPLSCPSFLGFKNKVNQGQCCFLLKPSIHLLSCSFHWQTSVCNTDEWAAPSPSIWKEVVGIINSSDEFFRESARVWLVRPGPRRSNQISDDISKMKQLASWCCYVVTCCRGCRFSVWQQKQKDFQREITLKCWVNSFWGRFKFHLVYFLKFEILTFFSVHILQSTLKSWHVC